eukprot:4789081-Pleurochrysis_carterae.AAC.5
MKWQSDLSTDLLSPYTGACEALERRWRAWASEGGGGKTRRCCSSAIVALRPADLAQSPGRKSYSSGTVYNEKN